MSKSSGVDANYRYIAASQEINARISQRQQALSMYVTIVVSLVAALVALKPGEGQTRLPIEWLTLGFPVASACLAFLNYKSERAITNLRHFLSELEQINNNHEALPSYNTDPRWAIGANKARRFHDYASAVLVAAGNAMAIGAITKIYPDVVSSHPYVLWVIVLVAMGSLAALLINPQFSYTPAKRPTPDSGAA